MLVIAHRGASASAPENTYAAFDRALQVGAGGLETDVRMTRDGVLVLMHDSSIDRTTNGRGRVSGLDWPALARLDAGGWLSPEFVDERVPRVDDFLDRYVGKACLCLEVKDAGAAEPLAGLLEARGLAVRDDVEVTSFSWDVVRRVHALLPNLRVGQLVRSLDSWNVQRVAASGASRVWAPARALTGRLVAQAHDLGLAVVAWDVANWALLQQTMAAGADGVALDDPSWLVRGAEDSEQQ